MGLKHHSRYVGYVLRVIIRRNRKSSFFSSFLSHFPYCELYRAPQKTDFFDFDSTSAKFKAAGNGDIIIWITVFLCNSILLNRFSLWYISIFGPESVFPGFRNTSIFPMSISPHISTVREKKELFCSHFMSFHPISFIFIGCIGQAMRFFLGTEKFRILTHKPNIFTKM